MTSSSLLSTLSDLKSESRIIVRYNSSRSDDVKVVKGSVKRVTARRDGEAKVVFQRNDGQVMEVQRDGKLLSYGSHAPVTGYAFEYEVVNQ
jgi:hypothetical protein